MSMTADQIVDRRRLRRKLSFWRVVGLPGGARRHRRRGRALPPGAAPFRWSRRPQIARVTVSGFIADDRDRDELLGQARQDRRASRASSSPSIRPAAPPPAARRSTKRSASSPRRSRRSPSIGTFGASAAYMTAIATDHIVARRTSITGSIGVLFQYPEVSELLDKLGVKVEDIKSAPLKAVALARSSRPRAEATPVIQGMVDDTYRLVRRHRRRAPRARPPRRAAARRRPHLSPAARRSPPT